METFLYNTLTQKREGPIRQGPYLVDAQPGPLPEGWVELVITHLPQPPYDDQTQSLECNEYANLQNNQWVKEYFVRNLTEQEIEDKKPKPPTTCTPRQFRLALISNNIDTETILSMINNIQNLTERKIALIEWEYSIEIKREHPLILTFAQQMGITTKQLDDIFILANTFN